MEVMSRIDSALIAHIGHYADAMIRITDVEATRTRDHLGEDPAAAFWRWERRFREEAATRDLRVEVPHRIGSIPGTQLVSMRILELALHAANLSRGTGEPWPIADELAVYISTELGGLIAQLGSTGGYAPPRGLDATMSYAERALRLSGR